MRSSNATWVAEAGLASAFFAEPSQSLLELGPPAVFSLLF
jgi:hypothetical protein